MEPESSPKKIEIKTLKCPKCGASLEVRNLDAARSLHCKFCDSTMHLKAGAAELSDSKSIIYPPKSALKIGLTGDFAQGKCQLVGRIRYGNAEGEQWDEWLLMSESGQYLWLQEDDWDFTVMAKFTPADPVDPAGVTDFITLDRKRLEVEEKSTGFIRFFEGELTWKATVDEAVHYIDAWDGDIIYSVEWTDEEIQFFKGREIKAQDLYRAFGIKEAIPKAAFDEDDDEEKGDLLARAASGKPFVITLISAIVFLLIALYLDYYTGTVVMPSKPPEITEDSITMGPYNLTHVNRVHKFEISTSLSNREDYCEFALLDEEQQPLGTFDYDFWHESGHDSDGYWSECSLKCKKLFVVKDAGDYYLEINSERKKDPGFSVKVIQDTFSPGAFYWMAALTGIYPALIILILLIKRDSDD